ncbi:unnamed protein product [Oncorhynchus mykiss]|uniref:PH domain-containing protein n=1 Tax=Oncorhynchus mykiss TaxID=8022 RepID=A0A060X4B5_ONCMY|nr:unnamed protein product [Oncorhynchus mykiss]
MYVFYLLPAASPRAGQVIHIAANTQEELKDWVIKIREVTMTSEAKLEEGKMIERRKKIALELSDLVIYSKHVPLVRTHLLGWSGCVSGTCRHSQGREICELDQAEEVPALQPAAAVLYLPP